MELKVEILLFCLGAGCAMFGWFAGRTALRRQHDRACDNDKIILFDVESFTKERDAIIFMLKSIHP